MQTRTQCERHRVYDVVNRRLTIWGVDRGIFFFTATVAVATFQGTNSVVGAALIFLLLYSAVRLATARDPQFFRILRYATRHPRRYDAAKCITTQCVVTGSCVRESHS